MTKRDQEIFALSEKSFGIIEAALHHRSEHVFFYSGIGFRVFGRTFRSTFLRQGQSPSKDSRNIAFGGANRVVPEVKQIQ